MTIKAATPTTDLRPASKRKGSRVDHYWWVKAGNAARALGIYEVPAICGRAWVKLRDTEVVVEISRSESGVLTDDGPEDACKVCVRMLLSNTRRQLQRRNRS